jgi:hypothetical protein
MLPACSRVLVTVDCYVGFMVLKTVTMKVLYSWGVIPCSLLKVNRYFGGNITSIFSVKKCTRLETITK